MLKKPLLFIGLFFFCACNSGPSKASCKRVKAGEFVFRGKKNAHSYRIVRNDVNQIETDLENGAVSIFRIKWLDPCTYELKFESRKTIGPDTLFHIPENVSVINEIVETSNDYYVFKSKATGYSLVYTDTLQIVKTRD